MSSPKASAIRLPATTSRTNPPPLKRPELFYLLSDSEPGDILLVEQVDRLARLHEADLAKLRATLQEKGGCLWSPWICPPPTKP